MGQIESIIEGFIESHPVSNTQKQFTVKGNFCPYFTPQEMVDLEGYYDNRPKPEEHQLYMEAITSGDPKDNISWHHAIEYNLFRLSKTGDDSYREAVLALGWNPEIEYNPRTQHLAKTRFESLMRERPMITIENATGINPYDTLLETKTKEGLYPVHIVTVRGSAPISGIITAVTNGEFSHAAISLDKEVKKLYSYNFDNKTKFGGGFSIEDIADYPKNNRLAVYTLFVTEEAYNKIQEAIENLSDNVEKTSYSILTLITFPFKSIAIQDDDSQICSQFVDSLLKLANLDLTNEKSSKVSPNKLYNIISNNKKAYKIFDGLVKDFDPKSARRLVDRLSMKVIAANLQEAFIEAKIPIGFNSNGDILINNPYPDFYDEYLKSHKLLKQYKQTHNLEGIKYELAKLYYMNYRIERILYHSKYLKDKEKNIKTRAKILNDFNIYLNYVLSQEPEFNFGDYYEKSEYNPNTLEIKKDTIGKIKNIISFIL